MINVRIDSRIRLSLDEVGGDIADDLSGVFTHKNPKHGHIVAMGYRPPASEPKLIKTFTRTDQSISVPRGGMEKVREVLRRYERSWKIVDNRTCPDEVEYPEHKVDLYDYQERIIDAAIAKQNCIVRAPTGSGKTTAAIGLIARLSLPALVIVHSTGLLKQWVKRLTEELGIPKSDVGIIKGGKVKTRPITVAMQQTLARMTVPNWTIVNRSFGIVLCDELQKFAATTFMRVVDKTAAKYRIGVSADETRKDRKHFLIYDVFGDVAAEVSRDELIAKNYVHDVEVRVVPSEFRADWYADDQDTNRLLDEMVEDRERNSIVEHLVQEIQNDGHQSLVFSQRREHCMRFDQVFTAHGMSSGLLIGGDEDAAAFDETVEGLNAGTKRIGVGTIQAIGAALDLPSVARGVVATPAHANKQQWGQIRGRLCRTAEGKTDAALYYVWDRHVFGDTAIRKLLRWNKVVTVFHKGEWVDGRKYVNDIYPEQEKAESSEPWIG